uniref:FBD domain-containing protein n=1 Tax=Arundo donax TaxID=35708 RepID=A0A0A9GEK8_ARUDO
MQSKLIFGLDSLANVDVVLIHILMQHSSNLNFFRFLSFYVIQQHSVNLTMFICCLCQAQTACSSDCICDHPPNWKTEELLLNHLQEIEIQELRGSEHEVAFVERLFGWATVLKRMTVTFLYSVTESKAKELFQMFRSFSRPGMCMQFFIYRKFRKVLYAPED